MAGKTWAQIRRHIVQGDDGQNLIEYALTLTLFWLMLFGIVDFGRALYAYHFVSHAAREATRWAAVNGYTCSDDDSCNGTGGMNSGPAQQEDIQSYVADLVPRGIDSSKVKTTPSWLKPTGSPAACTTIDETYPGCTVQVQVAYAFNFICPLLPRNSSTTFPCEKPGLCLSSTSEMVIAH